MGETEKIIFSHMHWGEFGQERVKVTLIANEKRRIPINVPAGRWMCIIKWRFGDINTNLINFRFNGCRNIREKDILIGSELLNEPTIPSPYVIASGNNGEIVLENTDTQSQEFEMVYDFVLIDDEIEGKMREYVFKAREELRGEIVQQQYKTK